MRKRFTIVRDPFFAWVYLFALGSGTGSGTIRVPVREDEERQDSNLIYLSQVQLALVS